MKKLLAALLCGVLLLFSGCKKNNAEPFDVHPPFYKIENAETGAAVYMLGSMHVGKSEAVYPQIIYAALDECDTLAVEVDMEAMDKAAMSEALAVLQCPDGLTARDFMGEDYDSIVAKFKKKRLYNRAYEDYIPEMWSSLWSNQAAEDCGYDGDFGTDVIMLSYAKSNGKRVEEIESAKEQYEVNAGASPELQMLTLNQTLALSEDEMQAQFDALYNAWRSGDTAALKALAEEEAELPEELKADYESYYDAMYTNRQRKMADYIEEKLESGGKTFVVVGALHYAAPPSIIDDLESDGIEVRVISYN